MAATTTRHAAVGLVARGAAAVALAEAVAEGTHRDARVGAFAKGRLLSAGSACALDDVGGAPANRTRIDRGVTNARVGGTRVGDGGVGDRGVRGPCVGRTCIGRNGGVRGPCIGSRLASVDDGGAGVGGGWRSGVGHDGARVGARVGVGPVTRRAIA